MKKQVISIALLTLFLTSCGTKKATNFLVGTYTNATSQGINEISYNPKNDEIILKNVISDLENPSFVITNKSKTYLVAVEEIASKDGGKVVSYSHNLKTGKFEKLSSFFTKGDHPCTVALSPKEDFVVVGNYTGGNYSVFPIDKNGILSNNVQIIQHEGKSKNEKRQEKPHVHTVVFHPKENKIFINDLGNDTVEIIPFSTSSKPYLQVNKAVLVQTPLGSGPRHLVFNSDGSKAFATFELANEVGVFNYKNGDLKLVQTIKMTTDDTQNGSAAEVRLSKDERFVYASVRGNDNFIAVLKFDDTNKLQLIQKVPTGKAPRNFILTDNDNKVLVASQNSNTIAVFNRDKKTGLLTATTSEFTINKPVYFYPF